MNVRKTEGEFTLLATGNFVPKPENACGGEMERAMFAGGDLLYRELVEKLLELIATHDRLTLHYSAQSKGDLRRSVVFEIVVWLILFGLLALMLGGLAPTRDGAQWLLLYLLGPGAIVGALYRGWKYAADRPNYGWEVQRVIDFPERQIVIASRVLGKYPEQQTTRIDFSDVRLVCYTNHYWESGPSIDLMLVLSSDLDKAEYVSECSWIANIFMGEPESTVLPGGSKIPQAVQSVIDALVRRSGIAFVDYVNHPEPRRKKSVR